MYDHESLKRLSKEHTRPLVSLYALAQINDPFMAGIPFRKAKAEWFSNIWQRFAFRPGSHIRRVHYVLISQAEPIVMPDAESYINSEHCYDFLSEASLDARYLLLVPARDLIDRRNDEPTIFLANEADAPAYIAALGDEVRVVPPSLTVPHLNITRPIIRQRYHLEIWCEKSTMNDVLIPLCRRYGINLVTGVGQLSLTHCVALVDRAAASGLPVRVLYISDFDKQGESMPVAVARKIEWVLRTEQHDLDVQVRPIVLTHEQCVRYRLPRTPAKLADAAFTERYGEGVTELDALEALHPGELERIMTREILRYYDDTLDGQIDGIMRQVQREVGTINGEVRRRHAEAIKRLETEREKLVKAITAFEKKAKPVLSRIERDLSAKAPDATSYDWPHPVAGAEDADPLFDSKRGYIEQVDRYKLHQDKPTERKFKTMIRTCRQCGKEFTAHRKDAVFCDGVGNVCRRAWRRAQYAQGRPVHASSK